MNSTHNMDNPQTEQPPTMSNTKSPKKEQAIILAVTADLKLVDYVRQIANIVGAKHMIFASRISNNRICIYLDSVELVDSLIAQYKSVQINEYEVNIRRLITPSQRIILSNVCPSIPNEVLINEIKRIGYTTLSPMTHLRAGIREEEFTHILSFKRQIFVQPNDTITLPSSLVIKFEDTNYRIFFSNDLICYLCKVQGHIASQCTAPPTQQDNAPEINPDTNKENQEDTVQNNMDCEDKDTRKGIEKMIGQKRAATSSSASVPHDSTENDLEETTVFKGPQQQKKRLKKDAYAEQMKSNDDKLVALRNATMAIGRSRRPRGPTYARGANRSQFEDPELAVNARHLATRRAHPAFKFFTSLIPEAESFNLESFVPATTGGLEEHMLPPQMSG
ncbi:hypothetical protein GEV33_004096 [Tenebrio molitor]|jgi:hypothetical protein|uniref:CCHC-type domain-containing protein n=1 Tax=Tenebrio molitor TaxID=7067 RepID=A0A8J6HH57_TENMO|nr:hypothetical protein GEV33_004096 [Tenebrio molitor]